MPQYNNLSKQCQLIIFDPLMRNVPKWSDTP